MAVYLPILSLAVAEEIENLVIGGNFEDDAYMDEWTFTTGAATASMTIDENESIVGKASLFVEITELDPDNPQNPRIGQEPIKDEANNPKRERGFIEKGENYTVSLFLKAEEERDLRLGVYAADEPQRREYVGKRFIVGTDWKEYWGTFKAPKNLIVGVSLRNTTYHPTVNYWIDCVRSYEGIYRPTFRPVELIGKLATTWAVVKAQYY